MGNLSEKLKERERKSRQSKLANNILGVFVVIFMVTSVLLYSSLTEEKAKLMASEASLKKSEDSLRTSNKKLIEQDSILMLQNEKLLELRGNIESFWTAADNSGRIQDYASYLERAIENDEYYDEALLKMNTLANDIGYVQITDSDGTKYLEEIKNLNTDDVFYRVKKAMSVRNGVLGDSSFPNTSRTGDVIKVGDVVKILQTYEFNSGAEWAKIGYDK